MPAFRVAVLAGDGIGPEVTAEAIRVAETVCSRENAQIEWNHLPWGGEYFLKNQAIMPSNGWDVLAEHDAILMGAVGHPDVAERETVHGLLLPMRRNFDQYVNLRPAYLFAGVESPLRDKEPGSIDFLVYRQNTEGEYAPVGGRLYPGTPQEVAVQSAVFTRGACEKIIRAAFEAARKRPRKKVTSITKSNAMQYGMALWDEAYRDVAKDYSDVESGWLYVDAAAMDMVRRPEMFDVIVASNLFGDILTDLSGVITGSVGLASSGNLNPERSFPSMFEPVHGSAPDIAGKGIANPMAAILSVGMLLDHLGFENGSKSVRDAVASVLKAGEVRTPDLNGSATTKEMGDTVVAALA